MKINRFPSYKTIVCFNLILLFKTKIYLNKILYSENIFHHTQSKGMSLDDRTIVECQGICATRISEFIFYPLQLIWRMYRRTHTVCQQQDLDFSRLFVKLARVHYLVFQSNTRAKINRSLHNFSCAFFQICTLLWMKTKGINNADYL